MTGANSSLECGIHTGQVKVERRWVWCTEVWYEKHGKILDSEESTGEGSSFVE